jgi:hypothetical protein
MLAHGRTIAPRAERRKALFSSVYADARVRMSLTTADFASA